MPRVACCVVISAMGPWLQHSNFLHAVSRYASLSEGQRSQLP